MFCLWLQKQRESQWVGRTDEQEDDKDYFARIENTFGLRAELIDLRRGNRLEIYFVPTDMGGLAQKEWKDLRNGRVG